MVACYILYSSNIDKFYVGFTQEEVIDRLEKHNKQFYGTNHFTSQTDDWVLFCVIECASVKQALLIEKHIKNMKSRKYLQDLKKYPEMIPKLLMKYQS